MRYLSVMAIHKLESRRLREWIEYHRIVGVEHFYLANNDAGYPEHAASTDVLAPYVGAGIVTDLPWPGRAQQYPAYNQLLMMARNETRWLAMIDVDEFILPMACETVPEVLAGYERFGGLAVNWALFGSSGCIERPPLVISANVHRVPPAPPAEPFVPWPTSAASGNSHVKTIFYPARVQHIFNSHFPAYRASWDGINERRERVATHLNPSGDSERIRINHYVLRSVADYADKVRRGRVDPVPADTHQYTDAFFADVDAQATVRDETIHRFLPELRRVLS